MPVVMKGGTSGNPGKDYIVPMPGQTSQPMVDTSTSGGLSGGVTFGSQPTGNHATGDESPRVPTGGGEGSGPEIEDPTATVGKDASMISNPSYTGDR